MVDGVPLALPTVFAVDLPVRTATARCTCTARSPRAAWCRRPTRTLSVTFTLLDGIVLARSGFNHSMNYRSAVVIGRPRVVTDADERGRAFDLLVDHAAPGRSAELRRPTRKELAATTVLALSLHESSVKVSDGDPEDEDVDIEAGGVWAGVIPLRRWPVTRSPVPTWTSTEVPTHVTAQAAALRDGR